VHAISGVRSSSSSSSSSSSPIRGTRPAKLQRKCKRGCVLDVSLSSRAVQPAGPFFAPPCMPVGRPISFTRVSLQVHHAPCCAGRGC
jgi:hypothetical protein